MNLQTMTAKMRKLKARHDRDKYSDVASKLGWLLKMAKESRSIGELREHMQGLIGRLVESVKEMDAIAKKLGPDCGDIHSAIAAKHDATAVVICGLRDQIEAAA